MHTHFSSWTWYFSLYSVISPLACILWPLLWPWETEQLSIFSNGCEWSKWYLYNRMINKQREYSMYKLVNSHLEDINCYLASCFWVVPKGLLHPFSLVSLILVDFSLIRLSSQPVSTGKPCSVFHKPSSQKKEKKKKTVNKAKFHFTKL